MAQTPTLNGIPLYCTIDQIQATKADTLALVTRTRAGNLRQFNGPGGEKRTFVLGWDLVPEATYAGWPSGTYNTLAQVRSAYALSGTRTFVTWAGESVTVMVDRATGLTESPTREFPGMLFYAMSFQLLEV